MLLETHLRFGDKHKAEMDFLHVFERLCMFLKQSGLALG